MRKILSDKTDESSLVNLTREISIISKLNHPSVLRFIYFNRYNFNNKPKPVIITEYACNGSFEDLMRLCQLSLSEDQFNDTRKLIIIYEIASGMSYLHKHNIIHKAQITNSFILNLIILIKEI